MYSVRCAKRWVCRVGMSVGLGVFLRETRELMSSWIWYVCGTWVCGVGMSVGFGAFLCETCKLISSWIWYVSSWSWYVFLRETRELISSWIWSVCGTWALQVWDVNFLVCETQLSPHFCVFWICRLWGRISNVQKVISSWIGHGCGTGAVHFWFISHNLFLTLRHLFWLYVGPHILSQTGRVCVCVCARSH